MPKDRKKKRGTRKVKKRLFILCEGEKTEYNYFTELIRAADLRGKPVRITVVQTGKNSPRELVIEAAKTRELPKDDVWVVFDKNGYTKHGQAFEKAKENNIKIAFSSISFEFWILIHFVYTTRGFKNSGELIKKLQKYLDYRKNDKKLFSYLMPQLEVAKERANKIRRYQEKENKGRHIFELNPYTNVDELIESINWVIEEYQ